MPDFPKLPNFGSFMSNLPQYGVMLREARELRGMSVEQLAASANIAPSALRAIEAGARPAPPRDVTVALAKFLGMGRDEREELLEAAELTSHTVRSALGQAPLSATPKTLSAAILVFLIADIRGYTPFTQERGDAAAARLSTRFIEMAQAAAERWDGRLIEARGDEALCVFASARQGVRAAHDLHERYVTAAQAQPGWPIGIGVGMDIGEAVPVGDGYRGAALNRAARLCGLAGPGETLVSTGVVYVAPQIEGVSFQPRGVEQLKGFSAPVPILLAAPLPGVAAIDPAVEIARDAGDE